LGDFDDKWTSLKPLIFLTLTVRYFFGNVNLNAIDLSADQVRDKHKLSSDAGFTDVACLACRKTLRL
jgi:hypothetical protein